MYKKLYTIGLTGGICSGKSTLKNFFIQFNNIKFVNFDEFTPIVYQRNLLLKNKLVNYFGNNILVDNEIDRKILGSIVFKDKEKLNYLKTLVSPELIKYYLTLRSEIEYDNITIDILVVEGPTIIESRIQNYFNEIWLVYASEEEVKRRFIKRVEKDKNKLYNLNTLNDILSSQLPLEEKKKYAKVIIDTSGTIQETQAQARLNLNTLFNNLKINYINN